MRGGHTPQEIRDIFQRSIEEQGWTVKAVGESQLLIQSFEGDPVREVKFDPNGIGGRPKPAGAPTVARIKPL